LIPVRVSTDNDIEFIVHGFFDRRPNALVGKEKHTDQRHEQKKETNINNVRSRIILGAGD
jgi:hypothetical protein